MEPALATPIPEGSILPGAVICAAGASYLLTAALGRFAEGGSVDVSGHPLRWYEASGFGTMLLGVGWMILLLPLLSSPTALDVVRFLLGPSVFAIGLLDFLGAELSVLGDEPTQLQLLAYLVGGLVLFGFGALLAAVAA